MLKIARCINALTCHLDPSLTRRVTNLFQDCCCKCLVVWLLFYYLAPIQNDAVMTLRCVQFPLGDKREVYLLDESALPVMEKESMREGKITIGPRMKYGHANLNSFSAQTNERVCIFKNFATNNQPSPVHVCAPFSTNIWQLIKVTMCNLRE